MNTLKTMERFENLRIVPNSTARVAALQGEVQKRSKEDQSKLFAQSKRGGGVFIYESKNHPGQVLEIVAGFRSDDLMSCLYEPHSMFNTPGEAIKAREELIELLERLHSAIPNTLLVADEGRGRQVELRELSTMQIVDMITRRFRDKGF